MGKKSKASKKRRKGASGKDEEDEEEEEEEDAVTENSSIDYSQPSEHLELKNESEYHKVKGQYEESIKQIAIEMEKIAPNLRANEKYSEITDKLNSPRAPTSQWVARPTSPSRTLRSLTCMASATR